MTIEYGTEFWLDRGYLSLSGRCGENLSFHIPRDSEFCLHVDFYSDSLFRRRVSPYEYIRNATASYVDVMSWLYVASGRKPIVLDLLTENVLNRFGYYDLDFLRLVDQELCDVVEAIEVFREVGYEVSPFTSSYERISMLVENSWRLIELGINNSTLYDAALYNAVQVKAFCRTLKTGVSMSASLSKVSFLFSAFLVLAVSLIAGALFRLKKIKYLIEFFLFTLLFWFFSLLNPDSAYTLQYGVLPTLGLDVPRFSSSWFLHAPLLAGLVYAATRTALAWVIHFFPATANSVQMATENLGKRKLRSVLVGFTIFITVSSLVSITTIKTFYGTRAIPIGSVSRKTPAIVYHLETLSDSEKLRYSEHLQSVVTFPFVEATSVIRSYSPSRGAGTTSPPLRVFFEDGNATIRHIHGVTPSIVEKVYNLSKVSEGWFTGDEEDEVLINPYTAEKLNVSIGDSLQISALSEPLGIFRVAGIYDPVETSRMTNLDGSRLIEVDASSIDIITTNIATRTKIPGAEATHYTMVLKEQYDPLDVSSILSLSYGIFGSMVKEGTVYGPTLPSVNASMSGVETYLPMLLIASLTIFNFAWALMYERRKEIATITSVGLNPSDITTIILTEGFVLVTIGGLTGTLVGTFLYGLVGPLFNIHGYVKSGPLYFPLTVGLILLMTLLGGYVPARKAGLMTTPSLMRRWSMKESTKKAGETIEMEIPVTIIEKEADLLDTYIQKVLPRESLYLGLRVQFRQLSREEKGDTYTFRAWDMQRTGIPFAVCTIKVAKQEEKFNILLNVRPFHRSKKMIDTFRKTLLEYTEWKENVRER